MSTRSGGHRVAVLSDVHGNAVGFEAVLADVIEAEPDLVVFGGDLMWGPLPEETCALARRLEPPAIFVRGNPERALTEAEALLDSSGEELTPRERWMLERHSYSTRAFLATFSKQRSSRSKDSARSASATARRAATKSWSRSRHPSHACGRCSKACRRRCSSARTHTSNSTARSRAFARSTPVASPYEGRPGAAFWALLGPDVELRHTEYDLDEAVRRYRATDDPLAEQMVEILLTPATPDQVVEHAEALELSG